jgi:hypothetical protein
MPLTLLSYLPLNLQMPLWMLHILRYTDIYREMLCIPKCEPINHE